jgi:hypothetical protein
VPKIRHAASINLGLRTRGAVHHHSRKIIQHEANRPCVASDHCCNPIVPDCPVALCGVHLREVYGFAADLVTDNWDAAVRDYVSELHGTFKPPKDVRQPRAGWLYFIRFGDRVKIGYTTNPDARLQALPHERVIGVIPGSRSDEAAWHKLLADYRVVGEWFRADPTVLEVLERVVNAS